MRDQQEFKHPSYYNNHPSGIECRLVIRTMLYEPACIIKYIWRCEHKGNEALDLKKAVECSELWLAEHKQPYQFKPCESDMLIRYIAFEANEWKRKLMYHILVGDWDVSMKMMKDRIATLEIQ